MPGYDEGGRAENPGGGKEVSGKGREGFWSLRGDFEPSRGDPFSELRGVPGDWPEVGVALCCLTMGGNNESSWSSKAGASISENWTTGEV